MEVWLSLETEDEGMCPQTLTSPFFWEYIDEYERHTGNLKNDVIGSLVERLGINIQPLLKLTGWDLQREEFPSDEVFAEYQAEREAAWQSPQELIECLTNLIQAVDTNPTIFFEIGLSDTNIEESYFLDSNFKRDLVELLTMAEWARALGVKKVRLLCG